MQPCHRFHAPFSTDNGSSATASTYHRRTSNCMWCPAARWVLPSPLGPAHCLARDSLSLLDRPPKQLAVQRCDITWGRVAICSPMVQATQHLICVLGSVAVCSPMVKTTQHLSGTDIIMILQFGKILHSCIVAIVHACTRPAAFSWTFASAAAFLAATTPAATTPAATPATPAAALATLPSSPRDVSAATLSGPFLTFQTRESCQCPIGLINRVDAALLSVVSTLSSGLPRSTTRVAAATRALVLPFAVPHAYWRLEVGMAQSPQRGWSLLRSGPRSVA